MSCIYGVVDCQTTFLVYVGKTVHSPARRLTEHLRYARRGSSQSHFHRWLRLRLGNPSQIEAFEIEFVSESDMDEAERFWIAYFRSIGAPLKNQLDGGEGLQGYVRTAEHNRKIGDALRGHPKSPEHIAAWRAANKFGPPSPAVREKLSRALAGRRKTPEHVAAVAARLRGKKRSAEHCRKMSEILRSPEVSAKLRRPRGPMLDETKVKISATKRSQRKSV